MQSPTGRSGFVSKFLLCACLCFASGPLISAAHAQQKQTSAAVSPAAPAVNGGEIVIPGPLKPFMRMAAISQQASPDEIVPFLARNIEINGYHGALEKNPKPTEFLVLLKRYLHIAKELQMLAGSQEIIQVANCHEADQLLAVIGYRLKQGCGPNSRTRSRRCRSRLYHQ